MGDLTARGAGDNMGTLGDTRGGIFPPPKPWRGTCSPRGWWVSGEACPNTTSVATATQGARCTTAPKPCFSVKAAAEHEVPQNVGKHKCLQPA